MHLVRRWHKADIATGLSSSAPATFLYHSAMLRKLNGKRSWNDPLVPMLSRSSLW
jgi:hypothetical protein